MKVESLLNQDPSRVPLPVPRPQLESPIFPPAQTEYEPVKSIKNTDADMARDAKGARGYRTRDRVMYPPFEDLEGDALAAVRRFGVRDIGAIHQSYRRIPYNSEKKEHSAKTGRDCFDVFHYDFTPEGEGGQRYTIMWDYRIGLVRMTPFFKCCKYPKTMPAKMLSQNPGLKDITHSITGGAIAAQGYWMPYECAKAACATFCHDIAGALIPIFGPDFPSRCLRREMPGFAKFAIPQEIIEMSRQEAEQFRRFYMAHGQAAQDQVASVSPRRSSSEMTYHGYGTNLSNRSRARRKRLSINPPQGSERDVSPSPGDAARAWYGGQYGIESATTTPRSAVTQSPNWAGFGHHSHLHHHDSHYPGESLSGGSGNLYRHLQQILKGPEHGHHWYGHRPPSPPSHHQSLSPDPGRRSQPKRDRVHGDAFEYAPVENQGGATTWREANDIYGERAYDTPKSLLGHPSDNDVAMALVSLREPERPKEVGTYRSEGPHVGAQAASPKRNRVLEAFHQTPMPMMSLSGPGDTPVVKRRRATLM